MPYGYGWKPYVSAAERRMKAERELAKLRKKGRATSPVALQGRKLATTFWGKAWNDNLEAYSDYENRLPRGRAYVRNGSILDLQVNGGVVQAKVMGSSMYHVTVKVLPLPAARWTSICTDCSGSIDSLVELLQGRLSQAVMERVCQQKAGLFPAPSEIEMSCTCPDWALMCKHVAAVLYGVGAHLDLEPALIFRLRAVDEAKLIASAATGHALGSTMSVPDKVLSGDDLAALFGLDMEAAAAPSPKTKTDVNAPVPLPAKKKAAAKPSALVRSPAKKATTKPLAAKKVASRKPTPKKPASKKPASKKAASKKTPSKKGSSKKAATKKTAKLPARQAPTATARRPKAAPKG